MLIFVNFVHILGRNNNRKYIKHFQMNLCRESGIKNKNCKFIKSVAHHLASFSLQAFLCTKFSLFQKFIFIVPSLSSERERNEIHLLFLCKWLNNIFKHSFIHFSALYGENVWKWFREVQIKKKVFLLIANEFRFFFFRYF